MLIANAARTIGHVFGAIFTLGLGNAAVEVAFQIRAAYNTLSALSEDMPKIKTASTNIAANKDLEINYDALGYLTVK